MACASHPLERLLLQRIDRHPIGIIDGLDLDGISRESVNHLMALGLIHECAEPVELDGLIVQHIGERTVAFSANGEAMARTISAAELHRFAIDWQALCRQIRRANKLAGPAARRERS